MRRLRITCGLVVLSIVAVACGFYYSRKEPVYEGRPISAWIDQLTGGIGNTSGTDDSPALPRLLDLKAGPEIVPYLCEALRRGDTLFDRVYAKHFPKIPRKIAQRLPVPNPNRDAELRYRAALILYYMGSKANKAVGSLSYALRDSHPEVRRVSASALGAVFTPGQAPPQQLLNALHDPMPGVRQAALRSLHALNADPQMVVSRFAALLHDSDEAVRLTAAQVLKDLGPNAKSAVPELIMALDDPNVDVFRFAAMALGRIGPAAKEAIPSLQKVLKQPRPYSETTVRWALQQIDTSSPKGL